MTDETSWSVPPKPITLSNHAVHVWRIDLDQPVEEVARLSQRLSSEETRKAGAFHFERDRRRYIVAHASLRGILGGYLQAEPEQVQLVSDDFGKPRLAGPYADQLYFNLSHSGELALVAVSRQAQIGVDLEHIRPLDDMTSLARQCFSAVENRQMHSLPAAQVLPTFFNTWTRKEAFIKAVGSGLSYPLDQFDVTLLPGEPARLVQIAGSSSEAWNWTLREIYPAPGYAAAYAVRQTGVSAAYWQWTWNKD